MEHPSVTAARERLIACKGHWPEVQERSGVSRSWLTQFARGDIANPTIDTLQALNDACNHVLGSLQRAS